jgi:hypothetical protein
MKKPMFVSTLVISFAISLIPGLAVASASAQEPGKPAPKEKAQPPSEPKPSANAATEQEQAVEGSEEALRRAISGLTEQVGELKLEVRKLRQESERSSTTLELMLYEERLTKAEASLERETQSLSQLDARAQDIQRRIESVPQEVLARGILRRVEGEKALRAEYQRLLEQTLEEKDPQQQKVLEAQARVEGLRQRVQTLNEKLAAAEGNRK